MRRMIVLTMLVAGGCLAGCKSFNANTPEDQQKILTMWSEFAKVNNVEVMVQMDYRGRGGLYFEQLYGVDLGTGLHGLFMFHPTQGTVPAVVPIAEPK